MSDGISYTDLEGREVYPAEWTWLEEESSGNGRYKMVIRERYATGPETSVWVDQFMQEVDPDTQDEEAYEAWCASQYE